MKFKSKQYLITSSASKDTSVTQGYNGSVNISGDAPSGTIKSVYCVNNGFNAYESAGFTSAIVNVNTLYITAPIPSATVKVTVTWEYL